MRGVLTGACGIIHTNDLPPLVDIDASRRRVELSNGRMVCRFTSLGWQ